MFKSTILGSLAATSLAVKMTSASAAAATRDCTKEMIDAIAADFTWNNSGSRTHHHRMMGLLEEGCLDFPSFCTNTSGPQGMYPLTALSVIGYTDVAEALIDNGCDVNAPKDLTLLLRNVCYFGGHLEMLEMYIVKGVHLDWLFEPYKTSPDYCSYGNPCPQEIRDLLALHN